MGSPVYETDKKVKRQEGDPIPECLVFPCPQHTFADLYSFGEQSLKTPDSISPSLLAL